VDRLGTDERSLLYRLSVFEGGWTAHAAPPEELIEDIEGVAWH